MRVLRTGAKLQEKKRHFLRLLGWDCYYYVFFFKIFCCWSFPHVITCTERAVTCLLCIYVFAILCDGPLHVPYCVCFFDPDNKDLYHVSYQLLCVLVRLRDTSTNMLTH